jgi:hypothetical protein
MRSWLHSAERGGERGWLMLMLIEMGIGYNEDIGKRRGKGIAVVEKGRVSLERMLLLWRAIGWIW